MVYINFCISEKKELKDMSSEEVDGLVYGGWLPVNNKSNFPLLESENNPQATELVHLQKHAYHPPIEKELVNRDWIWRPLNSLQDNVLVERQQIGGLLPLELSPRDIALGGVILSLLVTAAIGIMQETILVYIREVFPKKYGNF